MIWIYALLGIVTYFTIAYIVVMKLNLDIPVLVDVEHKALEIRRKIEERLEEEMEEEQ